MRLLKCDLAALSQVLKTVTPASATDGGYPGHEFVSKHC